MFSRRRAASNPPVNTNPTPSAATAAAQAFLSKQRSDATLSAAAAAAALRSHATSPTPVGNIQTKRMVRRGSNTSQASAVPSMGRQNSVGSMTGRTFRSPTPDSSRPTFLQYRNVPALPTSFPPVPAKSHKRALSLEPPPARVTSPTPKNGGRPMSMDRGMQPAKPRAAAARPTELSQVTEAPMLEQESSARSAHISRPMSPKNGPLDSLVTRVVPTGTKAEAIPANARSSVQQSTQNVPDQPVKRKKKIIHGTEGSPLVNGSHDPGQPISSFASVETPQMPKAMSTAPAASAALLAGTTGAATTPKKKKKVIPAAVAASQDQQATRPDSSPGSMSPVRERPSAVRNKGVGQLTKQPSTVVEDAQREGKKERSGPAIASRTIDGPLTTQAPRASSPVSAPSSRLTLRSVSQPPTYLSYGPNASVESTLGAGAGRGARKERHQSVSPVRSAHFSTVPVFLDSKGITKHIPPPRALSPGKSAMKHSPSSSVRSASPLATVSGGNPKGVSSDTSETPPVQSEDGSRPKKKKNVRVSFEEDRPGSPSTIPSSAKRAPANQGSRVEADGADEIMKPRPALPSFGSVRRSKSNKNEEINAAITSNVDPRTSASAQEPTTSADLDHHTALASPDQQTASAPPEKLPVTAPLEQSSDHAIGGILALDHASKTRSSEAPEEALVQEDRNKVVGAAINDSGLPPPASGTELLPATVRFLSELARHEKASEVPSIAVLPASPGLDEERKDGLVESSPESSATPAFTEGQYSVRDQAINNGVAVPSPPTEEMLTREHGSVPVESISADDASSAYSEQGEPAADEDSLYSDAEENLAADHEEGFASLDAILENPMSPGAQETVTSGLSSPSAMFASAQQRLSSWLPSEDPQPSSAAKVTDWEATRAYWSGLSEQRKQQIEHEASAAAKKPPEPLPQAAPVPVEQRPKKKKKMVAKDDTRPSVAGQPSMPSGTGRQYQQEASVRPPAMRQSMREAPVGATQNTHMRKTLRHTGTMQPPGPQGNKSVQIPSAAPPISKPRSPQQKTRLPPAPVGVPTPSAPRNAPTSLRPSTAATATTGSKTKSKIPSLRPAMSPRSDSSDSESSFRRRRKTSVTADGRYNMKRSMRGPPEAPPSRSDARPISPTPASGRKSSRFSIRSLSPTGSFTRRPMGERPGASIDMSERSLRTRDPKSAKSPTRYSGFGKAAKPTGKRSKPTTGFSSRFGDSSDEDDVRPAFRSRFADSDDEDVVGASPPADLTPVRGIPRRAGQASAESTDLSDSEDEQQLPPPASQAQPTMPTATNGAPEGSALAAGSLRDANNHADLPNGFPGKKDHKKRGFFGLGRKKESVPEVTPANGRLVSSVESRPNLERGSSFRHLSRLPRLQRANSKTPAPGSPLASRGSAWSKPPPEPEETPRKEAGRPHTSDGTSIPKTLRSPEMGQRTNPDPDMRNGQGLVVSARTGRKKKFPTLRRVFGLHD